MVYDSQQKSLATALGVVPTTVLAWLRGGEIRSKSLAKLYKEGISLHWLLDDEDQDINNMFTDTPSGHMLRARVFGSISTSISANPISVAISDETTLHSTSKKKGKS